MECYRDSENGYRRTCCEHVGEGRLFAGMIQKPYVMCRYLAEGGLFAGMVQKVYVAEVAVRSSDLAGKLIFPPESAEALLPSREQRKSEWRDALFLDGVFQRNCFEYTLVLSLMLWAICPGWSSV